MVTFLLLTLLFLLLTPHIFLSLTVQSLTTDLTILPIELLLVLIIIFRLAITGNVLGLRDLIKFSIC